MNKVSQQLLLEGSGNKVLITQSLNDLNERVRLLETRAYRREAEISRTEIRWSELRVTDIVRFIEFIWNFKALQIL